MSSLDLQLRNFVDGAFCSWDDDAAPPRTGTTASMLGHQFPQLPHAGVEALFMEWLESGRYLKALTLLKLLLADESAEEPLKVLLARALELETPDVPPGPYCNLAEPTDPVPREFLGTERLELAWSILEKDGLIWGAAEDERNGHEWIVSESRDAECESALLIWCSTTEVAGKLRPAGQRNVTRQRTELQVTVALLGEDRQRFGMQRLESEVRDLSPGGMGVWIADPLRKYDAASLEGRRVRVELGAADRSLQAAIADVCWVRDGIDDEGQTGWKLGMRFVEPTDEFVHIIENLLRQEKGDVQFLWNLWHSNSRRA